MIESEHTKQFIEEKFCNDVIDLIEDIYFKSLREKK